ncbi:lectin like domain-containing protein [uncultured Methanolobus sp.]|uniref:lectin like domain-containing protein n=1 Tax=uncultured Methanolobus sp. TaxID=218300 RepID=UPI002AAC418C|nr:lectin like domain-containing protein [uncultured Methanolobus sp.]
MKINMRFYKFLFTISLIILLAATSLISAGAESNEHALNITSGGPELSTAPINPAFIEYQEELEQERINSESNTSANISILTLFSESSGSLPTKNLNTRLSFNGTGFDEEMFRPTGLIPSPVDLSHLSPVSMDFLLADDTIKTSGLELMDSEVSYPARYDLREHNGVTAVRDQAQAGSCWTHSAIASLESYLLFNRSETWDFSENNMKNTLVYSNTDGYDRTHDDGGYHFYGAAYHSRWSGPVVESDDPYNDLSGVSPDNLPVAKHVQEIMILPGFEGNDTLYKWVLTHYGAISVGIMQSSTYFDSNNNSYYYYGSIEYANHAVTLVGWDDNYSAQNFTPTAPGNGAFIIKNSWGTNWGEDGYYYVSYYDSVMGNNEGLLGIGTKPYTGNFLYTAENVSNYDSIYQYDELGWVSCVGYYNSTALGANVFTASSNETLEAVSFYTVDSNSFYNISIYLDPDSGPVNSSGPVSVQNGTIAIAGYHTINLDTNVSLNTGQNFSVVVEFTTPNYDYPIAIEQVLSGYSDNAHAESGQSFVSSNGSQWTDISEQNANVCIKAFTTENKVPEALFVAGTRYVHVNETVDFHDASLFSPDSWKWDFGDSSTSSVQNPTHSYSETGIYTVSLNASNSYGSNTSARTSFIHVLNSTIVVNSTGSADFTTINAALVAASDGDTIAVDPGTYSENLYFKKDDISLISSTGNPEDVTIVSPDSTDIAIYIRADGITISNVTVMNSYIGIGIDISSECKIDNCYTSGNTYGIYLSKSQVNYISNCTSNENTYGLRLSESVNNVLNNNSMDNNTYNSLFDSHVNVVETNNLVDGKAIYYLVNSSDQVIDASSNAGIVHLMNCSNMTIENIETENAYCGFYVYESNNISIDNCTAVDDQCGVYLSSSDNNTIYSFNSTGTTIYGLYLYDSSNVIIENCTSTDNQYGIYHSCSDNNTISSCNTTGTTYYGLYLYDSNNVTVEDCTSTDNQYGVYLSSSDNNTIYGCNISDDEYYGIRLTGSSNNQIYNNYFNNSNNVYVSGGTSNDWNITRTSGTNIINGSYLGGNFWATPAGTGWSQTEYSVGDGFCDAYEITDNGNNIDYLPLTLNGAQPANQDDNSNQNDNDGIRVKIATSKSSLSNIVATDSSVRFVGKDAEVKYVFTDSSTPVNEISFESNINQGYVMASVSLLDEFPESSPAPSTVTLYQGMEILLGDEEFSSGIGDAKISFSVSKEWLESNDFGEGNIRMEHFSDGIWDRLPTVVTGEDDEYFYFEATTTGFSPFIICADVSGESQVNAGSSSDNAGEAAFSENIVPDAPQDSGQSGDNPVSTLMTISGLIVVTVLGLVVKMKKSE